MQKRDGRLRLVIPDRVFKHCYGYVDNDTKQGPQIWAELLLKALAEDKEQSQAREALVEAALAGLGSLSVTVEFPPREERDRALDLISGRLQVQNGGLYLSSRGPHVGSAAMLTFTRKADAPGTNTYELDTDASSPCTLVRSMDELTRLSRIISRAAATDYEAAPRPNDWGYTQNAPRTAQVMVTANTSSQAYAGLATPSPDSRPVGAPEQLADVVLRPGYLTNPEV
jgi:hypothetical protein